MPTMHRPQRRLRRRLPRRVDSRFYRPYHKIVECAWCVYNDPMHYIKTEAGQKAFKERSALFSSRQRTAFILFDGIKSDQHIMAATPGLGLTLQDIEAMVANGFLALVAPAGGVSATATAPVSAPAPLQAAVPDSGRTPEQRYTQAKPIATLLAASLGLRGFMLNLAVESAAGYEELLALLPKLQNALGAQACLELERALKD